MPKNHLFSCSSCKKEFPVGQRSAGMNVDCPFCDHKNVIPGMRQLRALPVAEEETAGAKGGGSDLKRFLFSAGLLVAVLGGILGLALSYYADSLATESILEEQLEFGSQFIGTMTPGHLWEAWDQMELRGLPDWQETQDVRYNKQAGHLQSIAYGLFGLGGLGLLSLLASFFVRGKV